jgi:glycine/D-amino acid oxidase-like deaminating enzyme
MHAENTQDVVVVGAGLAGLLVAAQLSEQGWRVRVLAGEHPGGRARSLLLGGLPVNPGPRAIYAGGPLQRALERLGVVLPGHRPATAGLGLCSGKLMPLPASLLSLCTTPLLHGGAARREAALLMARITIGAFGALDDSTTIAAWLQRHVRSADVRALLEGLVRLTTYCGDPALPASVALPQLRLGLSTGVHYIDGGWSSIVDALVALLQRRGVSLQTERAEGITVDDNGSCGVQVASGTLRPVHVVVATSLSTALSLCGHVAACALRPVTASCLDLVCAPLPFPQRRLVVGVDVPRYFSVHTPHTQEEPVIVHAMAYGHATREDLEAFVDVVQPGLVVRAARYLPKMVVHDDLPQPPTSSTAWANQAWPTTRSLHVVGTACGHTLLADGAADSAARVCRAIGTP